MTAQLADALRLLLDLARGAGEPVFDDQMRITNWPSELTNGLRAMLDNVIASTSDSQLRECVTILNSLNDPDIPNGLRQLLSRVLFDNPYTPMD